jgi:hypothetical protein
MDQGRQTGSELDPSPPSSVSGEMCAQAQALMQQIEHRDIQQMKEPQQHLITSLSVPLSSLVL